MTDYNTLDSEETGPDVIATSPTAVILYENPIAITEGAAGAPRIQTAALDTGVVTNDKIADSADKAGIWKQIESQTASSSAQLRFTGGYGTYDEICYKFIGIMPSSDGDDLVIKYTVDGGSTYITTNLELFSHIFANGDTSFTHTGSNIIAKAVGSATDAGAEGLSGTVTVYRPTSSVYPYLDFNMVYTDSANDLKETFGKAQIQGTPSTDLDGIEFSFSSGNIESGTIRAIGLKNF